MPVAIDFGNSKIKVGVFSDYQKEPHAVLIFDYQGNDFVSFISGLATTESCIFSQVRADRALLSHIYSHFTNPAELTHELILPFTMGYETPETLGRDRLAACAGAMVLFDERQLLIIDAGTCITYDLISGQDHYMGGAISPGIEMKLVAMHQFTDRLPKATLNTGNEPLIIGKNTNDCLLSGAVSGTLHEISGFIATFGGKQSLTTVLTGGHSQYLADNLEISTFAVPNLVLIGLNKIRKLNA